MDLCPHHPTVRHDPPPRHQRPPGSAFLLMSAVAPTPSPMQDAPAELGVDHRAPQAQGRPTAASPLCCVDWYGLEPPAPALACSSRDPSSRAGHTRGVPAARPPILCTCQWGTG